MILINVVCIIIIQNVTYNITLIDYDQPNKFVIKNFFHLIFTKHLKKKKLLHNQMPYAHVLYSHKNNYTQNYVKYI